jgi:hypothetical protein
MSGDHNMNQKPLVKTYCGGKPNYCTSEYASGVMAERQRIGMFELAKLQCLHQCLEHGE